MKKLTGIFILSLSALCLTTLSSCGENENVYFLDKVNRVTEATILNLNGQKVDLNTSMDVNEIKSIVHTLSAVDYLDYFCQCHLDSCGTSGDIKHDIDVSFGFYSKESNSKTQTYHYSDTTYSKYRYNRYFYSEDTPDVSHLKQDFSCVYDNSSQKLLAYDGSESYEDYQNSNNDKIDTYRINDLKTTAEKDAELYLSTYQSDCIFVYNTSILDDTLEAKSSDQSQTYAFIPDLDYYLTERDLVYCVNRYDGLGFSSLNDGNFRRNAKMIDEVYKNYQSKKYHYNFKYYFNLETGKLEGISCDINSIYTSKYYSRCYVLVGTFTLAGPNYEIEELTKTCIEELKTYGTIAS